MMKVTIFIIVYIISTSSWKWLYPLPFSSGKEEPKSALETVRSKMKDASETVVDKSKDVVGSAKDKSKKVMESAKDLVKKDKKGEEEEED